MAKYRKKPVVIEAVQWNGENINEVVAFSDAVEIVRTPHQVFVCNDVPLISLYINTLEGKLSASIGDYIIKGVKGECYACKPDIFCMTYEEVEDDVGKV